MISDEALNNNQAALKWAAQHYLALANQFRSDRPAKANFNIFRGPEFFPSSPGLGIAQCNRTFGRVVCYRGRQSSLRCLCSDPVTAFVGLSCQKGHHAFVRTAG